MKIIWTYQENSMAGINLCTTKEIIAKVVEREQQLFHHNITDLTVVDGDEILLYSDFAKVRLEEKGFSHLRVVVSDVGISFEHQNADTDDIHKQLTWLRGLCGNRQVYWYEIASQKLIASYQL